MTTGRNIHSVTEVPPGAKISDILPTFAGVKHEIIIGTPNSDCASCRKPFNETRKRRKAVRMAPTGIALPVMFSFHICGRCLALYQQGGSERDGVMAALQAYCEGDEAAQ